MNRRQRERNRRTAGDLANNARVRRNANHICENCGERGGHWVSMGLSLEALMNDATEENGFWTCSRLYGADGRRLPAELPGDGGGTK